MSGGYTLDQLRNALKQSGDPLSPSLLDLEGRRYCELHGAFVDPPTVYVPGCGWYCIGCELVIHAARHATQDAVLLRLAAKYDARVAARAREKAITDAGIAGNDTVVVIDARDVA
jgi:hypothetical protein